MSFLVPKKPQILYAPMLSSFGGGSARGFNPGGGGGDYIDITLRHQPESSTSTFEAKNSVAEQYNGFDFGAEDSGMLPQSSFSFSGSSKILKFTMPAGNYTFVVRGARGGEAPWPAQFTGTINFSSDTDVLFLGGINAVQEYGGGGATFFATGTNHANVSATDALLVAGGTASTYGSYSGTQRCTSMYTTTSSASTRQVPAVGSQRNYSGGAAFLNAYTVEQYSSNYPRAKHFVEGGEGGNETSCGTSEMGGFGGGGGGCPAGAGGYVGGYPGGDGATSSGSGGTSYRKASVTTLISETTPPNNAQPRLTSYSEAASGYLQLYGTAS